MNIDELLARTGRPSRYLGNEHNVCRKEWQESDLRMVLAFPDLYEIGMSHHGLEILYHTVNSRPGLLAERLYVPDLDFEKLLRSHGVELFSLESRQPVRQFDILGITLPYELCYSNILTLLDLAAIPLRSSQRGEEDPLVIGGGPCAYHPEPVADFFDAILLGDGEEAVVAIAETVRQAKKDGLSRQQTLEALSSIPGIYVPSFFKPSYDPEGRFVGISPLLPGYEKVGRAVLSDLDAVDHGQAPLVPVSRIVHDRLGVEIARGCTRGCRFCQAGIIYRPVRERSLDKILELAARGIDQGGFEEMALLSLSTGEYSCLSDLLGTLMDTYAKRNVSVSMPSMRVGTLTREMMEQIKRVRKTGFTIAPEAGTDRLRQVINKGITEKDLLTNCETAFELGWKLIKLYFMCGLPLERQEDLEAIPELLKKALTIAARQGRGGKINASIGVFVPKPHTPFQWHGQLSIDQGFERIRFIKDRMPKGATLKWNDPKLSFLEGVFSRGDRRLADVIEEAWQQGARLDGWSEHFRLDIWSRAAEAKGVDLESYLAARDLNQPLPWDHLDAGIDPEFLRQELVKAENLDYTPDCRSQGCQKCGLCDFKTVKPLVHSATEEGVSERSLRARAEGGAGQQEGRYHYRVDYSRLGRTRFVGHLEFLQMVFRAIRRAGLPINYSKGFHPTPKVSFGPALSVGIESRAEFFQMELSEPLNDLMTWRQRLDREMPDEVEILALTLGSKGLPVKVETDYRIEFTADVDKAKAEEFVALPEKIMNLSRKKKIRKLDVRPLVKAVRVDGPVVELTLVSETGKTGVKPTELLKEIFGVGDEEIYGARILKKAFREC